MLVNLLESSTRTATHKARANLAARASKEEVKTTAETAAVEASVGKYPAQM
jgi:hypothetical protein